MRRRGQGHRKIWPFALAVFLTASGAAQAAPTAAERETARRLMDEGKLRLKANEPAQAVDRFQKAHDIMHVPTTGIALARAHLAAGHLVEARDAALEVGRLPHEPGEPAVFDAARKHARELDAQLKPRIPTIRVKIKGGNAVRVAVDDIQIALSIVGEPVAVNPGKRVVSAKNAEGGEVKGEIELAERDAKEIELTLPAQGETPKTATAKPSTTPAPAPSAATPSPPPKLNGFGNDDIEPRVGERTPLAEGMIYGGFGVGVVGLSVGLVTGAMTLSKASDVEPQCENKICAPAAKNDLDSAHTLANISNIAVVVGAVGVAVGAIGFFMPKRGAHAKPRAGLSWEWTASAVRSSEGRGVIRIAPTGTGIGGSF